MNKRLYILRKNLNLTQEKFAQRINLSRTALASIEQGARNLTNRTISDICREFNVNEDWLRNGTEQMFKPKMTVDNDLTLEIGNIIKSKDLFIKNCMLLTMEILAKLDDEQKEWLKGKLVDLVGIVDNEKEKQKSKKKETENILEESAQRSLPDGVVLLSDYREEDKCDNTVSMPIYDIGASAATGVLLDSHYYEIAAMPDTPMTRKANFAVWVNDHSMEPEFNDGDLVLVRTQPAIDVGEIGIFIVNGDGFIKKQGEDRLISLNPDYDDVEISEWEEVYCKGKVLGKL